MGYTTEFDGNLYFDCDMTDDMFARLDLVMGVDIRYHKQLKESNWFFHIDIEISDDKKSLLWNGSEKSYYMERQVQYVIDYMKEVFPDFNLFGFMEAQGEEHEDHWYLVTENGISCKWKIIDKDYWDFNKIKYLIV